MNGLDNQHVFHFKNTSGSKMPAFALGQLKGVRSESGIVQRMPDGSPIYDLIKVKEVDGKIVVNLGGSIDVDGYGSGIVLSEATVVRVKDSVGFGSKIGPEKDKWEATSEGDSLFVMDAAHNMICPVTWAGDVTTKETVTTSSGGCGCNCIDVGALSLGGQKVAGEWYVNLPKITKKKVNGNIILPSNIHFLEWDGSDWKLDVADQLRATKIDGTDVTVSATLTGTIKFSADSGGYTTLTVDLDGTIP